MKTMKKKIEKRTFIKIDKNLDNIKEVVFTSNKYEEFNTLKIVLDSRAFQACHSVF